MITARRDGGIADRLALAEALADERRRMAADVHDLIMQDLSLALATARALADDPAAAPQASIVVAAGERALAGARDVIGGLVGRDGKPVVEAVEDVVSIAARGVPVSFDAKGVTTSAQPDHLTLQTLLHVGREGVTNAVKHAAPPLIEVRLDHADEWRLQVRDHGRGFDPDVAGSGANSGGFGIESMRRHAETLGGSLRVVSLPGGSGTLVEVVLP
jgi:signal transduction histidine kinase